MKQKFTLSAIGGLQPLFFFVGIYLIALIFAVFICSALFNAFTAPSVATSVIESSSNIVSNVVVTAAR